MATQTDESQLAQIQQIREVNEHDLLARANVQGVGIGFKESKGKTTGTLCVMVYVDEKKSTRSLTKNDLIPSTIKAVLPQGEAQISTDVRAIGVIEAQQFNTHIRPVKPGFSVGHLNITAGTYGCLVRDSCNPCRYYMLSNNHVLANSNAASIGDAILQPGPLDGGTFPADIIARLARYTPIHFGSPERYNLVDAALALPRDNRYVTAAITGIGIPKGSVEATLEMNVIKSGRTTEITTGKVIDTDATVAVGYGASGVAYFRNQIMTTNMSEGGDSGSLLLSHKEQKATGLLFAGSTQVTIHNHIANVRHALGVDIVTA